MCREGVENRGAEGGRGSRGTERQTAQRRERVEDHSAIYTGCCLFYPPCAILFCAPGAHEDF